MTTVQPSVAMPLAVPIVSPPEEFLEEAKVFLGNYRGRIAITFFVEEHFSITVLGRVTKARYRDKDCNMIMTFEVAKRITLELHMFLRDKSKNFVVGLQYFPGNVFDRFDPDSSMEVYLANEP